MSQKPDTLYGRLPAIFRVRDAEQGQPLRALLRVIEQQLFALTADVETTWDNAFIETCEEWLVPYIGEQLGVVGVRPVEAIGFSQRGHVANTIRYRRRKGTLAVLEQLASDLTRYPTRAVEFFQHIATTVHMQHVREPGALPARGGTVDVRDQRPLLRVGTAFDPAAHTADVRHISSGRGRYNLPNVGLFLYRVQSFEISRASAVPIPGQPHFFRFNPLGLDAPLFNIADAETAIESLAREEHVPHRLGRRDLYAETVGAAPPLYLGDDPELSVRLDPAAAAAPLPVKICHLGDVGGVFPSWRPPVDSVGVDPELGRMVFHPDLLASTPADKIVVDYVYGAVAPIGAGPFDRAASRQAQLGADGERDVPFDLQIGVTRTTTTWPDGPVVATLEAAVLAWNAHVAALPPERRREALGLVVILDSLAHAAPTSTIRLPAGARLHLIAAAWTEGASGGSLLPHRVRPLVRGGFKVEGQEPATAEETRAGGLWLNGLVIAGPLEVVAGDLRQLDAAHVTWPARLDSITVAAAGNAGNAGLELRLTRCLGGAVRSAGPVASLALTECLLHGDLVAVDLPGAALTAASTTLIGSLRGQHISADSCLFAGKVTVAQTQEGCLRFCFLTRDSIAPRRYRCQPDQTLAGLEDEALRAEILARVRPRFTSLDPGDPAYGQLASSCAVELRTGGEDGSEIGVYHFLQQALREANLRSSLRQYLRFGLEAGILYES